MCLESAVVPPGIYTRHCGNLAGLYWGSLAHLPPTPAPQTVGPWRGGRAFICVSMSVSLVHDMHSVNVWWMNVSLTTTSEIPWANRNTCYFLSLWVPNSGQLGHTNVESTQKEEPKPVRVKGCLCFCLLKLPKWQTCDSFHSPHVKILRDLLILTYSTYLEFFCMVFTAVISDESICI